MSAQAIVLVAAAGIALAIPLPEQFFSTDTEQTIFRVLIVAAAALVVWRDDFGLFKQTTTNDANSSTEKAGTKEGTASATSSSSSSSSTADAAGDDTSLSLSKIKILYASTTGNAKSLAMAMRKAVNTHTRKTTATVGNLKDYEPEDLVNEKCIAVVVSTWTGGEPPKDAVFFDKFLTDAVLDFRRSKTMLEGLDFCVFGLGSSAYSKDVFCTAAKRIHRSLRQLGATPFADIAFGDDAQGDMDAEFSEWLRSEVLPNFARAQSKGLRSAGRNDSTADAAAAAAAGGAAAAAAAAADASTKKPLSKRQARLLRQKQNEARYGPSRAKIARAAKKKQKMKPADLEEEDLINDTFLSLPERQEQEEAAAAAAKEKARQEAAANLAAAAGFDPRYLPEEEEEEEAAELAAGSGGGDDQDSGMLDIEAIGGALHAQKLDADAQKNKPPREMVTGRQRQALTKEGYKIIGTHSAVKLCRWTKHQLRGRGGCYKHTCYGITSYQCMEATPSLACANKCTFCWRHHKNPVGTEWRWKMDPPREIVKEAIRLHQGMINEYAGAPGVKKERLKEAFTVRHCALSLVGEPIMYPRINELVGELHKRHISTFLVTNAQFPECISTLAPVTQLYVSIDAATKESLKAVDRPLFSDFWERFIASLKALRDKRQRTVYRLTLLKGENMDGLEQYARLIAMGQPDFIEIKAVTFCGSSAATDLSHSNVPFHSEVLEFSTKLMNLVNKLHASTTSSTSSVGEGDEKVPDADVEEPLSYGIACEHHHSNLVLVAKTTFQDKETGAWNTWIDYEKFHKMVDAGESFTAMDYTAPTPYWAVYGAAERGMDPEENRWYHNRTVRRAKAGELSEEILAEYMDNPADQKHKMGSGQSDPFAEEKTSSAETDKKDSVSTTTTTTTGTGGGATENE